MVLGREVKAEGSMPAEGPSLTHRFSAIDSSYIVSERQVHTHV
jgi:hypothetical protein